MTVWVRSLGLVGVITLLGLSSQVSAQVSPGGSDGCPPASAAPLPRPSELWCGSMWKNHDYSGERIGVNRYLPTGTRNAELDLVSSVCRSCCRGNAYSGVVLERAEVRGWLTSNADLHIFPPSNHPANVENEITFDLLPDIDWVPAANSKTTPINSLGALLKFTTPLINPDLVEPFDANVMPPVRFHIEINGWGARACKRPTPEAFDPAAKLCEFARCNRPSNFGYEIFFRRSATADDSDCTSTTEYKVDLPGFSTWLPFNILPTVASTDYGRFKYCILQRTPAGEVRSSWSEASNYYRDETLVRGRYVRLVGTLWEDTPHATVNCWNVLNSFSADRGWAEMHPVDEIEVPAEPHPQRELCDPSSLPDSPNKARCVVQLCSAEHGGAPARRTMPSFKWSPPDSHPDCRYKVREVVDDDATTGFTNCSTYRGGVCQSGVVSYATRGSEFKLDAVAEGVPGERRGMVRAGYEIVADCCKRQCAGRCGGDDKCGGTCPRMCPRGKICNEHTLSCVAKPVPSHEECLASCDENEEECRSVCSGDPNCFRRCGQKKGRCLAACNR